MANDGMNYDVDLGIVDESGSVKKLNGELEQLMGSMRATSAQLNQFVKKQTADINKAFNEALRNGQQVERIFRSLSAAQGQAMGNFSRGTPRSQQNDAAVNRVIADNYTKTDKAFEMRLIEAWVKNETRVMKNVHEAVIARVNREADNIVKMVAMDTDRIRNGKMNQAMYSANRTSQIYNDPKAMEAKQTIDAYNLQQMQRRASNINTYGQSTVPTQPTGLMDRFNANGGADIMAIQARLMAGYQVLNMFFSAVRNGSAFIVQLDAELKQFQAITDTSSSAMIGFKDQLVAVAQESKFTAVELSKAATVMGQAGFSAQQVGEALGAVAMLAAASGSEMGDAVNVVTSAISIFNLRASEATDISNTMTAALNLSKLSMDKIALGMQYAGNIAAESGISYKEMLATLGTLANSGIMSGSTLGTGYRQLIIDIQNPTKKFIEQLKQVGLTEEDVNIKTKGFVGVLKTLHDAGFGTAQAFESFEVRAASTFAALDGGTDTITNMQLALTRSSAAVKANATQMESLQNKWSRLGSNAGLTLDAMFGPTVAVLKDVVDGLAEMFAWLNKFPKLLAVIGSSIASILGMLAFTQALAAIRGVSMAIIGMTTILRGAEAATIGLNIATKANPWLLILSAIVAVTAGVAAYASTVEDATVTVDQLTGKFDDAKAAVASTDEVLKSLAKTQEDIRNQQASLDADPILRSAKISEIIDTFKELSTEIDASTSSVAQLVEAMDRLNAAQLKIKGNQLDLQLSSQKELIELQKKNLSEALKNTAAEIGQVMSTVSARPASMDGYSSQPMDQRRKTMMTGFKDMIPDNLGFDSAVDIVSGDAPIPANLDRFAEFQNQAELVKKQIESLRKAGDDGSNELANLLDVLLKKMQEVIAAQGQILNGEAAMKLGEKEKNANALVQTPAYVDLKNRASQMNTDNSNWRASNLTGRSGMSPEQQMAAARQQALDLQANIEALTADASSQSAEVVGAFNNNVLPALKTALNDLNNYVDKGTEGLFKEKERELRKMDANIKKNITTLTKKSSVADSKQVVETLEKSMMMLMDQRRQAIKALFEEKIFYERDPEKIKDLQEQLDTALDNVSQEEQQLVIGYQQRQDEIRDQFLRLQKTNTDDQIAALKTKIDDAEAALKKMSPGEAFDNLEKSILNMADQLQKLMNVSSNFQLQLQNPNLNLQGAATTAASISADQSKRISSVMSTFMAGDQSLGLNPLNKVQASGILGHLMQESGVLANGPSGDSGLANGMAQWHPDRYAAMSSWQSKNGIANDETGQAKWLMHEMQTKYPAVYAKLQSATTPEEATRAFAGYEGFKDWDKPTEHAAKEYTARINNANAAYGVDASNVAAVDSVKTETAAIRVAAETKLAQATADAEVKKLTEQLQTQMSTAKTSGNPEAVMKLVDSIDDQYDKIIDQRTAEFKATNPDAKSGDDVTAKFNTDMDAIRSDQLQKTSTMIQEYWSTVQDKGEQAVKLAQTKLDEAQKQPEGKYTGDEMAKLSADVTNAQKVAQQQQLAAATQLAARANTEAAAAAATYGANSEQVRFWSEQEAQAKQKVLEITNQKNAADEATVKQGPSVSQAIANANQQWAIQNGLMQRLPSGAMQMVPLAQQVGSAWGEVLNGMTTNLTTLFTALADGSMSAKDAFKQFALSTVQMLMQMIAKALAMQLVMSTLGQIGTGGSFMSGLFGVPAMANGGGIPGAAGGEMITGGIANRDSVLRRLMPGEMVLRKSAVQQMGKNRLKNINAAGNRTLSPDGNPLLNQDQAGQNTVNVWVVSPDQQPQMGPNDVVAIIGDNIKRRGPLKQLIKEVQMGR